jgi:hypothetical protein
MKKTTLHCVTVSGSTTSMGEGLGESLRDSITGLVAHRLDTAADYLAERGIEDGIDRYRAAAAQSLEVLAGWDPDGQTELAATARAAGVDLLDLYATANLTDMRDVTAIGVLPAAADEGCTAFLSPRDAQGELLVGQTWDLNAGDVHFVVAVHRLPDAGPETWSVTVAGAPTLIGMNEHGVWVGTTNIKVRGARPGVGYLDIQHRAIRESSFAAAAAVCESAPRAAAHTYWYADETGGVELECSARRCVTHALKSTTIVQTNHCLDDTHRSHEAEPPQPSTMRRLQRARKLVGTGSMTVAAAVALMADRNDGLCSINRYPEDEQPTTTNACMVGVPAQRLFRACRGPADRGQWVTLEFDRG